MLTEKAERNERTSSSSVFDKIFPGWDRVEERDVPIIARSDW